VCSFDEGSLRLQEQQATVAPNEELASTQARGQSLASPAGIVFALCVLLSAIVFKLCLN